jgi:hypothetical protein
MHATTKSQEQSNSILEERRMMASPLRRRSRMTMFCSYGKNDVYKWMGMMIMIMSLLQVIFKLLGSRDEIIKNAHLQGLGSPCFALSYKSTYVQGVCCISHNNMCVSDLKEEYEEE